MKSREIRAIYLCGVVALAAGAFVNISSGSAGSLPTVTPVTSSETAQICKEKSGLPRLLIAVFHAPADSIGVLAADSMRYFWYRDECKTAFAVTAADMKGILTGSGFSYNKALGPDDLKLLAQHTSADVAVSGKVVSSGRQWILATSLVYPVDPRITQPLDTVTGVRLGLVSRAAVANVKEAMKVMPEFRKCIVAVSDKRNEDAVTAAKAAIAVYPRSSMARVCLAQALENLKFPADSVLTLASDILKANPKDYFGLRFAERSERAKGNIERANNLIAELLALNPTDVDLQEEVINKFAEQGDMTRAMAIVNEAKAASPGQPQIVNLEATICFALKDFKCAIKAYDDLATLDTGAVNVQYFERLVASLRAEKQFKAAANAAGRGVSKFPQNVGLHIFLSQLLREAGDSAASIVAGKKALALDPAQFDVYLQIAASLGDSQVDSLISTLSSSLPYAKTQADSATVFNMAMAPGQTRFNEADAVKPDSAKTEADWVKFATAIRLFEFAHRVIPTNNAKFLMAVSHFYLAGRSYAEAVKLQDSTGKIPEANKAKACELARDASDRVTKSQDLIEGGGGAALPTSAREIMNIIINIRPAANELRTKAC